MSSEKNFSGIDLVVKLFSLLYVLLVVCGLSYNYLFYKNFGINITEYIDLSEGLFLFLPLLSSYFIIFFVLFISFYYIDKILELGSEKNRKESINARIIIIIILTTILISGLFISTNVFNQPSVYGLITLIIFFAVPFFFNSLFSFLGFSIPEILRDIFYILMICLSIILMVSVSKTNRVKTRKGYKQFEVIFREKADSTIKSDSTMYYLGRTKNYLFLYYFKDKKTTILNVSDIKKVTFTE